VGVHQGIIGEIKVLDFAVLIVLIVGLLILRIDSNIPSIKDLGE